MTRPYAFAAAILLVPALMLFSVFLFLFSVLIPFIALVKPDAIKFKQKGPL